MKIKAAITQFAMSSNYDENIAKADSFIEKAAKDGANLVLLPELFQRYYFCQVEDYDLFSYAEEFSNSKTVAHFVEIAKKYHVVLPISFFEKSGVAYFNSLAMIDSDGKVLGLYRKSHIPTGECYEEKFYFAEGDTGFKVFKTHFGKIGIGICWDQWFPEVARILTLKGAEAILYPTAIGSEPTLKVDSMKHWQNTMRGHAAANLIPILASNRIGKEEAKNSSMTFFGSSFASDQHGEIIASLDRTEEGYRIVTLDLDASNKDRRDWGVFRDRRTDLYTDILKKSVED